MNDIGAISQAHDGLTASILFVRKFGRSYYRLWQWGLPSPENWGKPPDNSVLITPTNVIELARSDLCGMHCGYLWVAVWEAWHGGECRGWWRTSSARRFRGGR